MGTLEDQKLVVKLLVQEFLPADAGANALMRKTKKYTMIANSALSRQKVLIILHNSIPQGLCLFDDIDTDPFITYLTIDKAHRYTTASGCLLHYILNHLFAGRDVFFTSAINSFSTVANKTKYQDKYILDTKVRDTLAKLFKDT